MSDIREVNAICQAVNTDLQRRRELVAMTKPELITYVIDVENSLAALSDRFDGITHGS